MQRVKRYIQSAESILQIINTSINSPTDSSSLLGNGHDVDIPPVHPFTIIFEYSTDQYPLSKHAAASQPVRALSVATLFHQYVRLPLAVFDGFDQPSSVPW